MARSAPPTASELKRKPPNWLAVASELKNKSLDRLAVASELINKPLNWLAFASCASRERANFPKMPTSGTGRSFKNIVNIIFKVQKFPKMNCWRWFFSKKIVTADRFRFQCLVIVIFSLRLPLKAKKKLFMIRVFQVQKYFCLFDL